MGMYYAKMVYHAEHPFPPPSIANIYSSELHVRT